MCCNGVIFADVHLLKTDDPRRLLAAGLPIRQRKAGEWTWKQPCAWLQGCACSGYTDRPTHCRQFECALFIEVKEGRMEATRAQRVIGQTRRLAQQVEQGLRTLGDLDGTRPLAARFRRMARRLAEGELDAEAAGHFAELSLAMHRLNLVLGKHFYPGDDAPRS